MTDYDDSDQPEDEGLGAGGGGENPPGKKPYKVGYCNPPEAKRFKPGQSGNPKGRSKGTRNASTEFREALKMPITVTINGKRQKKPALSVIFQRTVRDAANGDRKAADQVRAFMQAFNLLGSEDEDLGARLSAEDLDLVRRKLGDDFRGGEDDKEGEEGQE